MSQQRALWTVNIHSQSVFKHWSSSRTLKESKGCANIEKRYIGIVVLST